MNKRIIAAILIALTIAAPAVYAADIALSSGCTLADAIIAANHDQPEGGCRAGRGADTIALTRDITLDGGLPKITSDIIIEGNGYTISGDHRYRMFYNDGGALTIQDLTMTKGYVDVGIIRGVTRLISEVIQTAHAHLTNDESFIIPPSDTFGGAIVNWEGTVAISDSTFSGNSADSGGAIHNRDGTVSISDSAFSNNTAGWGGAIGSAGELSIVNSAFSNNSADTSSGAIHNWGEVSISDSAFSNNTASNGGVILNAGELISIVSSTFSRNSADGGGAIINYGELSIVSSTFSRNSAEGGGAIDNAGELSIVSSTFSYNSAEGGGGAIVNLVGELSISDSTFSGNSANDGAAIYNWEDLSLINSIIAGNGGDTCYSRVELKRNISNFIQDGSCSPDLRGDPMLGELVEPEDGSPAYFPLLAGSRAIDAADDDYCPETDQIGTARPQGSGCDIGAIEYAAP